MTWRDIKPGGQLSARQLNDVAETSEQRVSIPGRAGGGGIAQTPGGLIIGPGRPCGFWARITGTRSVSGSAPTTASYPWSEAYFDVASLAWALVPGGRTGTGTVLPACEYTGYQAVPTDSIVWLQPDEAARIYWFAYQSTGITVGEQDGSPSYSGITTLLFEEETGLVVTQPATGTALVTWLSTLFVQEVGSSPVVVTAVNKITFDKSDGFRVTAEVGNPTLAHVTMVAADSDSVTLTSQDGIVTTAHQSWGGTKGFVGAASGSLIPAFVIGYVNEPKVSFFGTAFTAIEGLEPPPAVNMGLRIKHGTSGFELLRMWNDGLDEEWDVSWRNQIGFSTRYDDEDILQAGFYTADGRGISGGPFNSVTVSGGIVIAGSSGTSAIAIGATTVTGGTAGYVLTTSGGLLSQLAPSADITTSGGSIGLTGTGPVLTATRARSWMGI